jgi:hypothetical protein
MLIVSMAMKQNFLVFYIFLLGWSETTSSITEATYWPIVPALDDDDECGAISGMNDWQGKLKYSEKTCPSAALSTTNPTGIDLALNPSIVVGSSRLTA